MAQTKRTEGAGPMRVIRVPLGGDAYDRAALAAPYQIAQPFRAHITGLFTRPDPVDAIGLFQGIPPRWSNP
jgi:hypothetical protein